MSLILPGAGQIYNGRILAGLIWLLFSLVLWLVSAGLLGWIFHLVSAYCAYSYAKEHPVRV